MAGLIANLSASLDWDLGDFDRGTAHIGGAFGRLRDLAVGLGDSFTAAGRRMTLGVTAPLAGIASLTVNAASDAQELQSAFDYTFGAMAERMNQWAVATGDAMGRSTQEMQEGAFALGGLFNEAARTPEVAAEMSQSFTELAQDASSFFNMPFEEAIGRIRSGLTGEIEPLRRFNIFLNEASIEAKGLEMGLIETGQELTEQGKIMARAALIAEGLAAAQGDVERSSGSLENRLRALKGNIHELAVEFGEVLLPYAERVVGWVQRAVEWFKELPTSVKENIVRFALLAAAIGPAMLILKTLAVLVLPLLLTSLGPVAIAISAFVNPLGTLLIMAGKVVGELGGFSAVLSRIAPYFLRLLGPIGLVITAIMLFREGITQAFRDVFEFAKEYLGPKFEALIEAFGRLFDVFGEISDGPLGQFLTKISEIANAIAGDLLTMLGRLWVIMAGGVIDAVTTVVDMFAHLTSAFNAVIDTVSAIIAGDWETAWARAKNAVGDAIQGIAGWLRYIVPPLAMYLEMVGRAIGTQPEVGPTGFNRGVRNNGTSGPTGFNRGVRSTSEAGSYAVPGSGPSSSGGGGSASAGRTGPTAEELADRREAIRLEQELAVARERGDIEAIRALERQRDLRRAIEQYIRVGLSETESQIAAERDLAELDAARADAREVFLNEMRLDTERQVAELNNDIEHLRYLDEEKERERMILSLRQKGYDLAVAEKIAAASLASIEEARLDAAERRLAQQQKSHEMELARLRGDDSELARLEEGEWLRNRTDDLMSSGGLSRAEAEAQAMKEGAELAHADLQGTFRDTFRAGLQAALDGDLKGFFENWLKERSFDALSNVLDRLADQLANLVSGGGKGGGIFESILGIFGAGSGGGGGKSGYFGEIVAVGKGLPKYNDGARGLKVKGFPGIDQNLLSINGVPSAMIGQGEVLDIHSAASGGNVQRVIIEDTTGLFKTRVEQISGSQLEAVAPAMIAAGGAAGVAEMQALKANSWE
jgi:hypothetical protein